MNLDAERERLLGLAEKAMKGPWRSEDNKGGTATIIYQVNRRIGEFYSYSLHEPREAERAANGALAASAHDMAALIRAQAAEIERLRADAERYRHWTNALMECEDELPNWMHEALYCSHSESDVDAATDAAIAAAPKVPR